MSALTYVRLVIDQTNAADMSQYLIDTFKMASGKGGFPPTLRKIAELTDKETALKLADHFSGKRILFPCGRRTSAEVFAILELIGADKAAILAEYYTDWVQIPQGLKYRGASLTFYRYAKLIRDGWSKAQASHHLGINIRTTRRWHPLIEDGLITNNDFIAYGKAIGDEW